MFHNFAPSPVNNEMNEAVNLLIDKALEADNKSEKKREYLGGSRLGVECSRALYYEYNQVPTDGVPFPGRALRRFRMGHMHEDETADWLIKAGFDLRIAKADGNQFGFMAAKGKIRGHIDGIIMSGPDIPGIKYPCLWEHKIMKHSKYNEFKKNGIRKANFTYYGQCQTYMAYMSPVLDLELDTCLFTALDTDTSQTGFEVLQYDANTAQHLSDKGVAIISAKHKDLAPRIARDGTDFRCRWCNWKETCWKT